jgi:hypothetical protein
MFTLLHGLVNEVLEFDVLPGLSLAESVQWAIRRSTIGVAGSARRFFDDGDLILAQSLDDGHFEWLYIVHVEAFGDWDVIELAGPPCDTVEEIRAQLRTDMAIEACQFMPTSEDELEQF